MSVMSAEYMREYRRQNPSYVQSNIASAVSRREAMKRRFLDWLLTQTCVDCGESDPIVLDLDHRPGEEKSRSVSEMVNGGWGWETIEVEIAKCDVVCANCHRRRTASRGGWRRAGIV